MRGIALTMVVAFHLFGHGRVSGGVDVFLVISAYLLTGSIDRALSGGGFSLTARYARTFSRLLPAALLVLVVTAVASLIILPRSAWLELLRQVAATALLVQNMELAGAGLAYGAAGSGASPLQHYWSLSVQGQFLLLWPLLALAVAGLRSLARRPWSTRAFGIVTGALIVASFGYAVFLAGIDQSVAYYSFPARFWELGAGAALALLLARHRAHPRWGGPLAWAGVALILSSGFVVDGGDTFPGPWALWPVLGTLALLAGSESGGAEDAGLTRILRLRPITWLADVAYPLYLWHWPILVLYLQWRGQDQVGVLGAAAILVASVALSWLTQRRFVDPIARAAERVGAPARPGRVVAALVGASLVVAGVAGGGAVLEQQRSDAALAVDTDPEQHPGALELTVGAHGPWIARPAPAAEFAQADTPDIYHAGCVQDWRDAPGSGEVLVCLDAPGTRTVVLSGGSHAVQFYPALRAVADAQGWQLLVVDKDGCRLAAPDPELERRDSCAQWNEGALDTILGLDPDVVVTVGTETRSESGAEGAEHVYDGQVEVWRRLSDAGVPVVALRDTPRFPFFVPDCLLETGDETACGRPRDEVYAARFPLLDRVDLPARVVPIDLSDAICAPERCAPVVGNVLVYRDQSHLTATYAATLAEALAQALSSSLPELWTRR